MKKFILLFLLFSKLTFSQELVNSIDINLDKIKSFYRIEDPNNNDYALILKNKENIELIKADKSFNVLSRFEHTEIDKSGDFIGNSIKENLFYTYWKKNKKTLEVLTIDFENKKIIKNEARYSIPDLVITYRSEHFGHSDAIVGWRGIFLHIDNFCF